MGGSSAALSQPVELLFTKPIYVMLELIYRFCY